MGFQLTKSKVEVGSIAPDFILPSQSGQMVSLKHFVGEKPVVLFFYPKDDTPGCTKEACAFRDDHEGFGKLDAEVIGISGRCPARQSLSSGLRVAGSPYPTRRPRNRERCPPSIRAGAPEPTARPRGSLGGPRPLAPPGDPPCSSPPTPGRFPAHRKRPWGPRPGSRTSSGCSPPPPRRPA